MEYQKYIELGFERTDMNDTVEFKHTGHYGFSLVKILNHKMAIGVCSGELDKPKLYIRINNSESNNHVIQITADCVVSLCI
jgi:hypothetical protein